jgi:hypothetical protein
MGVSGKPGICRRWFKELIPVFLVLAFSIIFSLYMGDHSTSGGWKVVYRIFLRFFRFTILLCLPLYILRPIYKFILEKGRKSLLQLEQPKAIIIEPLKHWLFRPFQGIGIGFLFATKLLAVIQVITGSPTGSSLPFIPGHFQLGQLLWVTGITIFISLLLSTLWTLDDMGIRYYNRRDQELKMIGKYVGTLMPTIFGLYGLFSLLANYPKESALIDVFRIILAFYPPMVVFVVVHTHFITWKKDFHLKKSLLKKGRIWQD